MLKTTPLAVKKHVSDAREQPFVYSGLNNTQNLHWSCFQKDTFEVESCKGFVKKLKISNLHSLNWADMTKHAVSVNLDTTLQLARGSSPPW